MYQLILLIAVFRLCLGFSQPAMAAVVGPPSAASADLPDDISRQHVQFVHDSPQQYPIALEGTIDGTMTRMPVGYSAFVQGWQPCRSVRIENLGESDVINPRIIVNDQRNWFALEDVVAEAAGDFTSPGDRARAIWEFIRRRRFHACTWDRECDDPLKVLNVYGYTLCGNQAVVLDHLWRAAGFQTRRGFPVGHVVGEVFYDGRWHMMDSDEHVICLLPDNRTIAAEEDIVQDHDLLKRLHTYGISHRDERQTDEFSASLYGYEGERGQQFNHRPLHAMDLLLRPGESLELRTDHVGKQYSAGQPLAAGEEKKDGQGDLLAGWGPRAYALMRNGILQYQPDLHSPTAQRGAARVSHALFDCQRGQLRPADATKEATITWHFSSPYVLVGGRVTVEATREDAAVIRWQISPDGEQFVDLAASAESRPWEWGLDEFLSPAGQPTYRYWLRLVLKGDVAVTRLHFTHDIQTSALCFPELACGVNRVLYRDDTNGGRHVRVSFDWRERSGWHRPTPPPDCIFPLQAQTVIGSRFTFQWQAATDPDGDRIVDYHFELSEHPDMRWPLSPNFERLISLTPEKGTTGWAIPYTGLLNPGTWYYWRVRALDATGVWSPWSSVFRFQVEAPAYPVQVRLNEDRGDGYRLSWQPNPLGTRPVAYKVYGSDERGFTPSDTSYLVFQGKGFVTSMEQYEQQAADAADCGAVTHASNLIARIAEDSLRVIGPELDSFSGNKAFYRVVAVDSHGQESGPSECVAAPRLFFYSPPAPPAHVGQPYRHELRCIRSLGDLRCRRSPRSSYNAAFWDRDQPLFSATTLPPGLAIDTVTGVISGIPSRVGAFEVACTAANQFQQQSESRFTITVRDAGNGDEPVR